MMTGEKCERCDGELIERKATADKPYGYKLSGLSNVFLIGITVLECPLCGAEHPRRIPRIGVLHRVIAECLIRKAAPLLGEEIRYLRKYAGFAANELAIAIGIDPAHLSRVENGKRASLRAPAERMVRALAMDHANGGIVSGKLRSLVREISEAQSSKGCPMLGYNGRDWQKVDDAHAA